MILTCQECAARFLVPDKALMPHGRRVRCGKCKHEWMAPPPDMPEPALDLDAVMASAGEDDGEEIVIRTGERGYGKGRVTPPPPPPAIRRTYTPRWLTLIAVLLFLAAAALMALTFAPHRVGLPSTQGLTLQQLTLSQTTTNEDSAEYTINGSVLNRSNHVLNAPQLRFSLLKDSAIVHQWTRRINHGAIQPGEQIQFSLNAAPGPRVVPARIRVELGNPFELWLRPVLPGHAEPAS